MSRAGVSGGWADYGRMVSAPLPCVVYRVDVKGAAWFGRYAFLGANPVGKVSFPTEAEACAAIEALGWTRRPDSPGVTGPHFDRPATLNTGD